MGPYAGVDYNLILCPLFRLQKHIYHGQPYARVDLNPMPESTLSPSQGLWIWPLHVVQGTVIRPAHTVVSGIADEWRFLGVQNTRGT
jgi:hypothetical protein